MEQRKKKDIFEIQQELKHYSTSPMLKIMSDNHDSNIQVLHVKQIMMQRVFSIKLLAPIIQKLR